MLLVRSLSAVLCALALAASAAAQTYILGAPDLTLETDGWAVSSSNMSAFKTAIANPAYFGPAGTVTTTISLTEFSFATLNAGGLAGVDGFIVPWWHNAESAAYVSTVTTAFQNGMDLWLLEDDSQHNGIGAALGLYSATGGSSVSADGSASNGTAPFFSGPFGTATNTGTAGNFAQFDAATISALNGTIIGTNTSGQITAVYWAPGAYSAHSGALIVFSDVDMISNWLGNPYSPTLASNGVLALNTVAALAQVPEPSTYALLALGGIALLARRRR